MYGHESFHCLLQGTAILTVTLIPPQGQEDAVRRVVHVNLSHPVIEAVESVLLLQAVHQQEGVAVAEVVGSHRGVLLQPSSVPEGDLWGRGGG